MPRPPDRRRITVLQPYVPDYRVPFFDELARLLAREDLELSVAHGSPQGKGAGRGDAVRGPWSQPLKSKTVRAFGHELRMRRSLQRTADSALVVAELASGNLDTYLLALRTGVPLLLWGHGKAYVTPESRVDERLERWLAMRAAGVLVYTRGGADHMAKAGISPAKITILNNSTDTLALRRLQGAVTDQGVEMFRRRLGLADSPTVAFVGSLDESKLLPLLFEACDHLHSMIPGFQLILAGDGPEQGYVAEQCHMRPYIKRLARANQTELVLIGKIADLLINPGRVGLVAVDAAVLGLPVVTTDFQFHAPELEYLDTECMRITEQDGASIAEAAAGWLRDPAALYSAQNAAREAGRGLSVESMAARFAESVARTVRGGL